MSADVMKILIVDDDHLSRKLLGRALENAGFNVIECKDGVEAFQVLEQFGPALVVLDYEMPELNGAEICEVIRNDPNHDVAQTPIILLTAHSGEEHELECLKAGADDFVSKPVNTTVLKARIETHLRLYALRRQLQEQNDELEDWRQSHEMDLEAARLTQQAIIPQRMPVLPGWDFAAQYLPVIQVGGDIYDWLRLPDDGLLLWIADAAGHGVSAALLTTLTKILFRHAAAESAAPDEIMRSVNADFHSIFRGRTFMTALCIAMRPESGQIHICGAGHPPLLIARKNGEVDFVASGSPPLGVSESSNATEEIRRLESGDGFLIYTDGLYSATDAKNEHLDPSSLPALIESPAKSAEHFLSSLIQKATAQFKGEPLPDDIAAVAAFFESSDLPLFPNP